MSAVSSLPSAEQRCRAPPNMPAAFLKCEYASLSWSLSDAATHLQHSSVSPHLHRVSTRCSLHRQVDEGREGKGWKKRRIRWFGSLASHLSPSRQCNTAALKRMHACSHLSELDVVRDCG